MPSPERRVRNGKVRWLARYRDPAGKQRSKTFDRQVDAQDFLDEMNVSVRARLYGDDAGLTVRRFVEARIEFRFSDPVQLATRQQYEQRMRRHVFPHIGDVRLSELTPELVEDWALTLKAKGLAPSTVRGIASCLRSLLSDGVGQGRPLRFNPVELRSVRAKIADDFADRPAWEDDDGGEVAFWEEARVAAVIAALRPDLRILGEVCVGLGVRQGELLALAVDDFDFAAKTVTVRAQVKVLDGNKLVFADLKHRANRKKRQDRTRKIPLPDDVARRVREHIAKGKARKVTMPWAHPDGRQVTRELLFVTREGKAWNRNYLNRHWHAALRAAGVPVERKNGMHALRHHYASLLIDAGVPVTAVAAILGHASAEFTLRVYGHKLESADDRALAAVNDAVARRAEKVTTAEDAADNVVELRRRAPA